MQTVARKAQQANGRQRVAANEIEEGCAARISEFRHTPQHSELPAVTAHSVKLKQAAAEGCEGSPERPKEVEGLVGEGTQQGGHV